MDYIISDGYIRHYVLILGNIQQRFTLEINQYRGYIYDYTIHMPKYPKPKRIVGVAIQIFIPCEIEPSTRSSAVNCAATTSNVSSKYSNVPHDDSFQPSTSNVQLGKCDNTQFIEKLTIHINKTSS